MGITGLLPFLKDASTQINISELRNQTVAIDAYCWLHKGAFGCAEKLARGEDTNGYVLYCLKYIKMLQQFRIKPIMVFDGQHLPAKKATEEKRRQQRAESKKRAQELLRLGRSSEAYSYVRRSIDITHKMALNLIKECRNMGIDCIVAPYEADAQLAYLNMSGMCHAVISEDSDLVLFGCKRIVYKLDLQGQATLVDSEKIPVCMKIRPDSYTFEKFRYMCILSGCDYLESLPGIGIKKALNFVSMTSNPNIYDVLPKLPSYLKMKGLQVTNEYRKQFMVAEATFQHQIIYDPVKRKLAHLTDPHEIGTKEEYLVNAGKFYDEDLAFQMALGNVDPFSRKELDDWVPTRDNVNKNSIWIPSFKKVSHIPKEIKIISKELELKVKVERLTVEEIEQQKAQEDDQLEKELSVYLKDDTPKRKREEVEEEPPLSPVLKKKVFNPFKKISKFERTEISTSEIKVSRYFFRKDNANDQNRDSTIIVEESVKKEVVETVQSEKEVSDLENETPPNSQTLKESPVKETIVKHNQNTSNVINSLKKSPVKSVSKIIRRTKSSSNVKKEISKNQPTLLSMFSYTKPLKLT